jgi:hypothetical protein
MEEGGHRRRSSSRANGARPGLGLYRLDSNHSSSSIFEDVEMAHDEVCLTVCGVSQSVANIYCSSTLVRLQRAFPAVSQPSRIDAVPAPIPRLASRTMTTKRTMSLRLKKRVILQEMAMCDGV